MSQTIVPVLLGADLNCYNIARAFHMKYGVKSYAFARYAISATKYSRIVHFTCVPDIDTDSVMLDTLHRFADAHIGDRMVLFGCTDDYVAMIIRNREELSDFVIPYPPKEMLTTVSKKAEFYEMCDKFGIPHPDTVVLTDKTTADALSPEKLGFSYPIIVKPSSSVDYWKHSFNGMKKVYTADSPERAAEIVNEIYSSGYPEKIILQEFIAGGDSQMRVFTCFSDEHGKVRAMCLGHTMLEEHTPKGLGNHAAIVTEPVSSLPIADKIKDMLEALGYTGFSNFDIKLREGTKDDFRVFEINLRQGRSNFYLTSAGLNVAYLANEVYESDGNDCNKVENVVFWHHIPKSTAYKYTEDKALVEKAKKLAREGREYSSVWYTPDMRFNPLRTLCVLEQLRRQKGKFKKYYPVKK
ncbi:MAG: ATP-grasp domain-containing protein [Eubacteriales bacterium]|nr:ATP-grasp domain-containing protein [Clostridia bacterium]MDY2845803.1 ATP-grasp domain-containing protein [Eubacteriales bacterium]